MSVFQFTPNYAFGRGEHRFVTWNDGFSDEEINLIRSIGDTKQKQTAMVGGANNGVEAPEVRRSNISWIQEQDCPWLYEKLGWIVQQLNGQFYDYDLWGFYEDMQFTTYTSEDQGFYDWHMDSMGDSVDKHGVDKSLPRKFSVSLQLSDPSEYEGGDLLIRTGKGFDTAPKAKGTVVAFPSFILHKVTPVTSGIRKSLVVWVTGPAFK